MTTISVSSAAGLTAALKSAHPGDTIQLAAGNYSGTVISGVNFSSAVTITSANPSNEAVLSGLKIVNSSGLNFSHLDLSAIGSSGPVDPYYAFRITSSSNINFSNIAAYGDPNQPPSTQISGFYISQSNNVSITGSDLEHFSSAIVANNNTGLVFSGNSFSNLDKGGIEMGGSSQVSINNNSFTNFDVAAGTHADAIQVYTAGTTQIASNIAITDNTITRGSGDPTQGIFVQDEVGSLPFHNLTIENNSVIGEMWNSIYVKANVTGTLDVENNLVESWAGVDKAGTGSTTATTFATTNFLGNIDLLGNLSGAAVTETGNTAQGFLTGTGTSVPAPAGNTLVGSVTALSDVLNLNHALSVKAETATVQGLASTSGNLLSGDVGASLYLADIGVGSGAYKAVSSTGSSFVGSFGTLVAHPDGSFTYTETKGGLTVGQTYVDHFTATVASATGGVTTSTLDVSIVGSATGNGLADTIIGGAGAETITAFGAGSHLSSGTGQDTFTFNGLASSTVAMQTDIDGFKAGDIIDLTKVDPNFHIVTKFDGHPDELVLAHIGPGNWEIMGETTGSKVANFEIHLTNANPSLVLSASSFHL